MDWALPEIHPFELGTGEWGRGLPLPWALVDPSVNQQNQTLWEFGHDPDSVLLGFGLEEDKAKPQTLKSMGHDKCSPPSTLSWAVQGLSAGGEKQSTPLSCQGSGRQRPMLKSVSFFNKEWGREASQGAGLPEVPTKHP